MKTFLSTDQASVHFTYHELLWLPTWGREANESDGLTDDILARLVFMAKKMDGIRDHFDAPVRVHCFWRPPAYNALPSIGGKPNSAHQAMFLHDGTPMQPSDLIAACDFDIEGMVCDDVRDKIIADGLLDSMGLRMENRPGSNWVHLDSAPVVSHRFFNP